MRAWSGKNRIKQCDNLSPLSITLVKKGMLAKQGTATTSHSPLFSCYHSKNMMFCSEWCYCSTATCAHQICIERNDAMSWTREQLSRSPMAPDSMNPNMAGSEPRLRSAEQSPALETANPCGLAPLNQCCRFARRPKCIQSLW